MSTTLDGQALFDEQDLQIACDSIQRASIERSACGLDGMLSIDLGQRTRKIQQSGMLRAASAAGMNARANAINAFLDGQTHTLATADGREYANLRMDTFKQSEAEVAGFGLAVKYEIVYTQLRS